VESVAHDTARNSGARQSGGITTVPARDTTRRAANPPPAAPQPPPPPVAAPRYDDAAGRRALDHLSDPDFMDTMAEDVIVDSAKVISRASLADSAKAYAAYTLAQLYVVKVQDVGAAREWISTALRLAPGVKRYKDFRTSIDTLQQQRRP